MNPYVRPANGLSRRSLLAQAGLAAAALATVSACGSDTETAPAASGSAPASGSSSGSASAGGLTVQTDEIPVGSGKIFADAQTVVTQPEQGSFKAFSSICTHARCPVAEVTSTINCQCHGSKFSITDGSPQNGPAQTPLPAKTVTVEGSSLSVSG